MQCNKESYKKLKNSGIKICFKNFFIREVPVHTEKVCICRFFSECTDISGTERNCLATLEFFIYLLFNTVFI